MPSFSIALSGLQANAVALSTIGNNLANLNTTSFKKQDVKFADLFYQTLGTSGSTAPMQVGTGTRVSSVASDFTQGNLSSTGNSTDMALNGNGFFVVQKGGERLLTRAGNFQLDPHGELQTTNGERVMGYSVTGGVLDTNVPISPIRVPTERTQLPRATSDFSFLTSLDASAANGNVFTSATSMYDSHGQAHTVSIQFTKTAANTWNYTAGLPPGEAASATGTTGSVTFNTDGTLATPAGDVTGITFAGLGNGAADMKLKWKLRDANGDSLLTQIAGASSTNGSSQNGFGGGTYKSFAVDAAGLMTATYTNGGSEIFGQLAVAVVASPESLSRAGGDLFGTNQASGAADIGAAGTGSRGTVAHLTLEQSNVDISTEFAALIVAQRSFEANSKTVTAFDTITQDTLNLIR